MPAGMPLTVYASRLMLVAGREEDEMSTLTERMAQWSPARRKRVAEPAQALVAEEMSLRNPRRARKQTQTQVRAPRSSRSSGDVSRLEQRSDLLISTLSGYVAAMDGKLTLVAEFPNWPPVALTGWCPWRRCCPSAWPSTFGSPKPPHHLTEQVRLIELRDGVVDFQHRPAPS